MARRKGWLYVELLVAMTLAILVLAVGVSSLVWAHKGFEGQKTLAETEIQTSRILAFVESLVMSAGTGLPSSWDTGVFVLDPDLSSISWLNWRQIIQVCQVDSSTSHVPQKTSEWGNALCILSATPLENTVTVESLSLEPGQWAEMRVSLPIHDQFVTGNKPGDWFLFPGLTVPLRIKASLQTGRIVTVKALQAVTIPLAQPLYRLVALDLRHVQRTVTGDFFDGAGRQPLFRHVEELAFRFNEETSVLNVKVRCANGLERTKSWRLRN